MRVLFFAVILTVFSCSSPYRDSIVNPKLDQSYYVNAMVAVNQLLTSDPNDLEVIEQNLFYCEKLNWPVDCVSALDAYKRAKGLTNKLVTSYITYYVQHEQHELLLGLIDRWIEEYDLKEEYMLLYIKSLVSSSNRKQASLELRQYLVQNQSAEDLLFAADQYLQIGDTAMAVFCLGKIHGEFPRDPLMWPYGFALVRLGYPELGLQVLKEYLEEENGNADLILSYAVLLDQSGRNSEARDVIKPLVTVRDTATFLLADWYLKNRKWDSAGYVLNDLIQKDSSNRKPIWKAGRLYEDQGWFSTSMRYYEYLVELDSLDTLASQRIDLIQRKIAYLQRLKFEESKITTIELQPKKIKINE